MVVTDPRQADNPIVLANHAFLELTGYSAEEVIGRNCRFLQGPETDPRDLDRLRRALAGRQEHIELEIVNHRKDGTAFWNRLLINPVTDEEGQLIYYFSSQKDVTALRRSEKMEETERILLMEVDHRAMNALALVQSVVGLSRADSVKEYAAAVRGRVQSIALAHRMLAEASWSGADLDNLIQSQLPVGLQERVAVSGCSVLLPPSVVQPLALILHELTSNALRHGALAGEGGSVEIDWLLSDNGLSLQWRETDAGTVSDPQRKGVGLTLLEGIVDRQLQGSTTLSWRNTGLEVALRFPLGDFGNAAPEPQQ